MTRARDRREPRRAAIPRRRWLPIAVMTWFLGGSLFGFLAVSGGAGANTTGYVGKLPHGFPTPRVPASNPMTLAKAEVGRRLFYDTRLSGNGTQSCSSCHQQDRAFTDGRPQAIGSTGDVHPRNAQSLVNVAYMQTLTWANPSLVTLEQQVEVPLFNEHPVEMGVSDANRHRILKRIQRDPWYRRHFPLAFPKATSAVSWASITRSITTFERTIVSADSRYDRYLRHKASLTAAQTRGMNLFMGEGGECHHCHGSFIFNDQATYAGAPAIRPDFHNTGLFNIGGTGAFPAPNRGLFEITGRPQDMGRFRAPSLRNVALTAPYMHDGSIKTLRQVVDFYADGGRIITDGPNAGDGRKSPFKDPETSGIKLTERDRRDLVAFLRTLTDRSVTRDPKLSDPFHHRDGRRAPDR